VTIFHPFAMYQIWHGSSLGGIAKNAEPLRDQ
jgi:hypothetical protein